MENKNVETLYDVVIIGGGPAGLTAALYLARARYRVVVVEKDSFGGQITITDDVVNYPGVARAGGKELTEVMRRQAESFGAEFMLAEVDGLELDGDIKTVRTGRGDLHGFGVLIATGAHPRMIGFKGEAEFRGHGVAYCATCDGEFFTGKEVFVVGGGFAAAEESVFLTKYASHVTILIREDDFTCAPAVADSARSHDKITILTNTEVDEITGDSALRSIRYRNNKTGEVSEFRPENSGSFGVFVFAGYSPATDLVKGLVELNKQGYILTDREMRTNREGVYAAGDVCVKALRQVVTAVGDGALAATELEKYAAVMQRKTGLHPVQPKLTVNKTSDAPVKPEQSANPAEPAEDGALFDDETREQLRGIFAKMANPLTLELHLDDGELSGELRAYMQAIADLSDKLEIREAEGGEDLPFVKVLHADGRWSGIEFHGVPGGHEFTSFVLGLYNVAGPGQAIDDAIRADIAAIKDKLDLTILVSLSCTMCPELVTSAQRIAAANANVTTKVYDIGHFPELREKYNAMSVPCLAVNGERVTFGKKNIRQLLDFLKA